ncbi:MAG: OmpW family outer membrane protein [Pseudomonadota bacterium]|nr:OmpW family outer membrane protein [Pseudomonadota bacterium]
MIRKIAPIAAAVALFVAAPAMAQSKGDFTLGLGVHNVAPKSSNGTLVNGTLAVDVGNSVRPTITGEYFIADNLGIELIAALPFQHDIDIKGLGKVGSTKHLPPTLSVQYHFGATDAKIKPFVGAGVNYTWFYGEKTQGALNGTDLRLGNSWGVAAHAGIDFAISEKSAVRVDVRWIDIDSKVKLDKAPIGTANIDPLVYGASYVMKF